jgi:hypothetical protein
MILAAGDVSNKFSYLKCRCISPALIPVNTRPLAAHHLEFYTTQGLGGRIFLVVNEGHADLVGEEMRSFDANYILVRVPQTSGVVETLKLAVELLPPSQETIVNVVTTIPTALPGAGEVQLDERDLPALSWSTVSFDHEKRANFHRKGGETLDRGHAFTGVFRLPTETLRAALNNGVRITDLLSVVECAHKRSELRFTRLPWIDCGRETNYYEAKARLISSRSFNRIRVASDEGTLTKSSTHDAKLRLEADFILSPCRPTSRSCSPRVLGPFQNSRVTLEATDGVIHGYRTSRNWCLLLGLE